MELELKDARTMFGWEDSWDKIFIYGYFRGYCLARSETEPLTEDDK
jgi:hypothetical protein